MIKYADGSPVRAGDAVLLHGGMYTGTIYEVIDSLALMAKWGLRESGLMIDTSYGGLVFHPKPMLTRDEIQPAFETKT